MTVPSEIRHLFMHHHIATTLHSTHTVSPSAKYTSILNSFSSDDPYTWS